jgi:NAD(P)-dependent dehydrogenase (short-subunit alcohol dehydrogenase family)
LSISTFHSRLFAFTMSSKLPESSARAEGTGRGLLSRSFAKPKPLARNVKLTDQVAIITGSNVGLGLEAARQLLQLGLAHLVMGVRSQAKGDVAADTLRKSFPRATISVWLVDMEAYDSVRAFADKIATLPRIDMVILNAAVIKQSFSTVPATGHETSLQTNYLSTALLAILLIPILKAKKKESAPPVLTLVGSDTAYTAAVETKGGIFQQFDKPKGYVQMDWYGREKLLLALFTAKLAEFVSPNDVLVNMVNPGMTRGTGLARDFPGVVQFILGILQRLLGRRPEVSATTYLDAVITQGAESHGSFISEWMIKP